MAIQRVTADPSGRVVARCPACAAELDRERVGTPVRTLLRCACGRRFAALLERRAAVRRQVRLRGTVGTTPVDRGRPTMILNLSRTGLLYEGAHEPTPAVGDTVWVRFALDAVSGPSYRLRGRVVRVDQHGVAAEFTDLSGREAATYDLALALYRPPSTPG